MASGEKDFLTGTRTPWSSVADAFRARALTPRAADGTPNWIRDRRFLFPDNVVFARTPFVRVFRVFGSLIHGMFRISATWNDSYRSSLKMIYVGFGDGAGVFRTAQVNRSYYMT